VADQRVKDFAYQILEAQLANGMSGAQNPTQQFVASVPTPASMQQPQVMSYSDIEPAFYEKRLPMEGRATFLPFRDTMEGSVFNERELAVPGILAELMNAFTAPARSMTDPTFNAGEEAANMAMNVGGSGLAISRGMKAPTGQGGFDLAMNAYHGTPYDIKGGFDLGKVGTGEGAQAYGHGMYFGEARATGEQYAKDISRSKLMKGGDPEQFDPKISGKSLTKFYDSLSAKADRLPYEKAAIEYEKMGFLEDLMQGTSFKNALSRIDDPKVEKWAKSLEKSYKPAGNLYKVDIPDEQIPKMLNWDEPLNKQPQAVKDAFKKLGMSVDEKANKAFLDDLEASLTGGAVTGAKEVPNPTGESLYNKLVSQFGSDVQASESLRKLGVTGIRYLDEGSRAAGKGTSNFVVFDPKTVKILEKNDIPVPNFDVVKTNASEIFGKGAERVRYTDPKSGGFIDVLSKPDGTASVMGLEVPKEFRGTGIGKELQSKVLSDFPVMGGQVSSKAAATNAYKLGRRPVGKPNATLEDVLKTIDEDSSVNLVSTEMQKMFTE